MMKYVEMSTEPVDPQILLQNLGYGSSSPSSEINDLLELSLQEARGIEGVKGVYTVKPITGRSDRGLETAFGRIESARFAAVSGDAAELVFGLVTAGRAVDEKVAQSADMIEASIWDALGTAISEQAVENLLSVITSETGETLSMPFSPGYCDWELTGQAVVFNALDPSILGIDYFKDSFMMTPQKSVSFVACIGKEDLEKNPCKYCTMKKCFMRRK